MEKNNGLKYNLYFIIFLASITIIRLIYIKYGPLDLSPDEAHYWEWSRRLDLSYYSKGPVIAYIFALLTAIGGNTEFAIRTGAVAISILVSIILFVLARDIFKSEKAGFFAAVLPALTPLYSAGAVIMTIDAPFILLWGSAVYVFKKAVIEQGLRVQGFKGSSENASRLRYIHPRAGIAHHGIYWHLLGIIIGLGLLTKYTMAFIYPCLLLFLLLSKEDRFWLKRKEPYIAFALSIVIFSPVIIWNMQHDWVTIKHTAGQAHIGEGFRISIKDFLEFIGSQFGVITPFIFLVLCYSMWRTGISWFRNNDRDALLLFSLFVPVFLFFLLKSAHAKVQANWTAPAYFTAFIAAGGMIERFLLQPSEQFKRFKLFIIVALATGAAATIIAHDTRLLNLAGINIKPKNDPANRLRGWEELGSKVGTVYNEMLEQGEVFIFSDKYQVASELAFYVPGNPAAYNINLGRRLNQYDFWQDFDSLKGKNGVYVKDSDSSISEIVREAFSYCTKEPLLKIYRGNAAAREFSIFRCYNFKGMRAAAHKPTY